MWTLEGAVSFIQEAQKYAIHCNFNLALGGGVLNRGFSDNDLDIFCFPRSKKDADHYTLLDNIQKNMNIEVMWWEEVVYAGIEDGRKVFNMSIRTHQGVKHIDWIVIVYNKEKC